MNQKTYLANGLLWATAIVASAILGAPSFLTLILLPGLAATALASTRSPAGPTSCRK